MICAILTNPDSSVVTVTLSPECIATFENEQAAYDAMDATAIIDDSTLPSKSYRGAWVWDGSGVVVDMDSAIIIQKEVVRAEREIKWNICDELLIDSQEPSLTQGEKDTVTAEWSATRQKYKDAPDYITIGTAPDVATLATLTFDHIVSLP